METSTLLSSLQEIQKRAERVDDENVIATYVDDASLVGALGASDNGVLFGRRGTGKTHALKYLAETERDKGNFVVYLDLEQDTGSSEGRYVDQTLSTAERATRLIVDVLSIVHDRLLEDAFEGKSKVRIDLLDAALDHFREVVVVKDSTTETEVAAKTTESSNLTLGVSQDGLTLGLADGAAGEKSGRTVVKQGGPVRHRVHFGAITKILRQVLAAHDAPRFWLLIDEWSSVPIDLQPYLAQMLRSLFFGLPKVTVRLAAIRHRTNWVVPHGPGDYVGIEVGAEFFPLLDLDEFVIFAARSREEQKKRSTEFFKNLLFRHVNQVLANRGDALVASPDEMAGLLFTQVTALEELVRAAEGVPRDALSILGRAGLRTGGAQIGVPAVREAAAQIYQTTKAAQLNGSPLARSLMDAIVGDVLGGRKARAFLLLQDDAEHPLIQQLVDERLLHMIKRGYSSKDEPGVRYDVLQIDYGCYVNMIGTASGPSSLFGDLYGDDDTALSAFEGVEVPEDDYRAIRRSILDLPTTLDVLTAF